MAFGNASDFRLGSAFQNMDQRYQSGATKNDVKSWLPQAMGTAATVGTAGAATPFVPAIMQGTRFGTDVGFALAGGSGDSNYFRGLGDAFAGRDSVPVQAGRYYGMGTSPQYQGLNNNESLGTAYTNEVKQGLQSDALASSFGTSALNFINPTRALGRRQASKAQARNEADAQAQAASANAARRLSAIDSWAAQFGPGFLQQLGGLDAATKLSDEELQQRAQQFQIASQRAQMGKQVDAYFMDPSRMQRFNANLKDQQAVAIRAAQEQAKGASREHAFDMARGGQMGGSVDISNQGKISRARDAAAYSIAGQAADARNQFASQDQAERQRLHSLIYSEDPEQARALQFQLGALRQQGQGYQDQAQTQAQQQQLRLAGQQAFSQSLGSMFTNLGRGAQSYYLASSGG